VVGGFLKAAMVVAALTGFAPTAGATGYLAEAKRLLAKGETKAAEIELKNAVRSNPKDMEARYRLALIELALGQPVAAEADAKAARAGGYDLERTIPLLADAYLAQGKYRQLLQDFPAKAGSAAERAGVLVARGYAQIALGQPAEARQSFEKAESLAPRAPQPLLAEVKLLASQRQFAAAEAKLDQALTFAPKSPQLLLEKAALLRMKGENKAALALLDKLLKKAPGFLPARLERGEILLFEAKLGPARKDIDAVLAAEPGNVAAIYLEAILLGDQNEFKKAETDLEKISAAIPALPRGYFVEAYVKYRLGELPQAEEAARRYAARNPKDLAVAKLLGLIELSEAKPAATIARLEKFAENGTADAGAFGILGQAYTEIGRTAEALKAFEKAQKLQPKSALFNLQLGASRLRMGEAAGALGSLEHALKLAPSNAAGDMIFMTDLALGRWQAAADIARKLQQAMPKSPTPLNLLALVKLAQFNLAGTRADLTALAAKFPDFLPARLNLARVAVLEGKPAEAERILQAALEKDPTNRLALGRLMALLLREGRQKSALAAIERAHSVAPTDKQITARLIAVYLQLGHKKKALGLARDESGGDEPSNIPVIAVTALAQLAAGEKGDAAQSFRRLIMIEPDALVPRRELASVLLAEGDAAGARHALDEAIKIAPHNPQLVADRIAVDLKASGIATALATAARIEKSSPALPTAPALEGDVYLAARQYAKATEAYQKAFRKAPSAMLAVRLARALSASGKPDAAAALLRDWLEKHPDDIGVTEILASFDLGAHRYTEAKAEFEKVVAKEPLNAVALNDLAWLYQRAGDPSAKTLAERAYVIAPKLPQTADTLGWILVQQREAANALGLLEEASGGAPADLEIRYHFAVALSDTGHRSRARQLLASLTKKAVKFDDKKAAQKLLDTLSKS
jgi:putative PEP-CTERM system TPR-repeat lipoprotein